MDERDRGFKPITPEKRAFVPITIIQHGSERIWNNLVDNLRSFNEKYAWKSGLFMIGTGVVGVVVGANLATPPETVSESVRQGAERMQGLMALFSGFLGFAAGSIVVGKDGFNLFREDF